MRTEVNQDLKTISAGVGMLSLRMSVCLERLLMGVRQLCAASWELGFPTL